MLNEDGAQAHAVTAAEDTVRQYLENDFDPVPCPDCGHYQRYMFPKLYEGPSWWLPVSRLAVIALACVCAIGALYWAYTYAQKPADRALVRMSVNGVLLVLFGLLAVGLAAVERCQERRFDPNLEDKQARIEKGRRRAIPRAEFDAAQSARGFKNPKPNAAPEPSA